MNWFELKTFFLQKVQDVFELIQLFSVCIGVCFFGVRTCAKNDFPCSLLKTQLQIFTGSPKAFAGAAFTVFLCMNTRAERG